MNRHNCILAFSLPLVLAALLCGCAGLTAAPVPMRSIAYPAGAVPAKCLFVLLPGRGDTAETFAPRGFVEEIKSRGLSIDMVAADATFGYYIKGTFRERLEIDVIAPAKARGYQELWLTGPSMGGFGSLFYARTHATDVTGTLAIAPFLGDRKLIAEIAAAGGLKNWRAPARVDDIGRDNYQGEMWRWFQAVTLGRETAPLIFMGYGTADSLASANALLAAELPQSRVFLTTGGHEWPAWRRVLASFLDSADFAGHCR